MVRHINKNIILTCVAVLLLAGCSLRHRQFEYKNLTEEVTAIKAEGGIYKVGNPYTALGQRYIPREDYNYKETGVASWYGSDFHNKRTANGELYNMHAVTAAHRTLPLPSIVRVTNLENGKSIIARVNDRGPYVKNRIIDLSQKGAEMLGYKNQGTARVKVEIMAKESKALKEAMLSATNSSKTYNKAIKYSEISEPSTSSAVTPSPKPQTGNFFVQVGAFSDLNKAKEVAENMSRFGKVSIEEAYLSKNGIYRVRIGAYKTRDEAMQILDRVLDYGHADVTITEG